MDSKYSSAVNEHSHANGKRRCVHSSVDQLCPPTPPQVTDNVVKPHHSSVVALRSAADAGDRYNAAPGYLTRNMQAECRDEARAGPPTSLSSSSTAGASSSAVDFTLLSVGGGAARGEGTQLFLGRAASQGRSRDAETERARRHCSLSGRSDATHGEGLVVAPHRHHDVCLDLNIGPAVIFSKWSSSSSRTEPEIRRAAAQPQSVPVIPCWLKAAKEAGENILAQSSLLDSATLGPSTVSSAPKPPPACCTRAHVVQAELVTVAARPSSTYNSYSRTLSEPAMDDHRSNGSCGTLRLFVDSTSSAASARSSVASQFHAKTTPTYAPLSCVYSRDNSARYGSTPATCSSRLGGDRHARVSCSTRFGGEHAKVLCCRDQAATGVIQHQLGGARAGGVNGSARGELSTADLLQAAFPNSHASHQNHVCATARNSPQARGNAPGGETPSILTTLRPAQVTEEKRLGSSSSGKRDQADSCARPQDCSLLAAAGEEYGNASDHEHQSSCHGSQASAYKDHHHQLLALTLHNMNADAPSIHEKSLVEFLRAKKQSHEHSLDKFVVNADVYQRHPWHYTSGDVQGSFYFCCVTKYSRRGNMTRDRMTKEGGRWKQQGMVQPILSTARGLDAASKTYLSYIPRGKNNSKGYFIPATPGRVKHRHRMIEIALEEDLKAEKRYLKLKVTPKPFLVVCVLRKT